MNKSQPLVSINLVVHNREPWLQRALDSIRAQTYQNIEINQYDAIEGENIGFWAGQEKLLERSKGAYIICISDVVLDSDFVEKAVEIFEGDAKIGALQAKILQNSNTSGRAVQAVERTIDTAGFEISKSRRITNRRHGEIDREQYHKGEIFAVEGAVPIFRREALEDAKIDGHFIDPNFRIGPLGYGDDLDLAWRMRLLGWKQWYSPDVIAYHDRSTTRNIAHYWYDSLGISRITKRKRIPIEKRRLDWLNVRFTIIKNDYIVNVLRDAPFIFFREVAVFFYTLIIEPSVFRMVPRFFRLLPKMIRQRKQIMHRARTSAREMKVWFR